MSSSRRNFLSKLSSVAGVLSSSALFTPALAHNLEQAFHKIQHLSLEDCSKDETFWYQIKLAYTVSSNFLNLNNGGVSPQPKVVQDAVVRHNQFGNESPTYYMWRYLEKGRKTVKRKLAELAGCDPGEIAIHRNASEALETIIFGLRLKAGDEVILSQQDYPNMINAWKQRAHRDGIVLKWVTLNLPGEDKSEFVKAYMDMVTPKTKILHLTHMINWSGQLLPAKEIIHAAKQKGLEVVVDAAHTFAHIDFNIHELGCDYLGTSLHKWLCAPFGSGMLYVKKEKIKPLYPLFAASDVESEDIGKFENLGTRSSAIELAISTAVDFHQMIGTERKQNRLFYLKDYWTQQLADLAEVRIHTPRSKEFSGAICLFTIEGMENMTVCNKLEATYRIHVVPINWEYCQGIRVTPNVYTVTEDMDRLVTAIREIVMELRAK